ncbi:IMPACT family protein [Negadavirga shengliensis]|uniref:IMPACT family protein n=1 Tax=Negadavirga shengliensis TaxID=1389218 RepID=A0ABV9T3W1_9BACT
MKDTFLTLGEESTGIYKEKGSRFLSFASRVDEEATVQEKLGAFKRTYHDARHHCYAYVLGRDDLQHYRTSDDGEPHHSAGDPILGQIRSFGLTNVLVVVVRYFGGTKLGVGGLVQAYKTAAAEAILANKIVEETIMQEITLNFPYPAMNEVMKLINVNGMKILSQAYDHQCRIKLQCREMLLEKATEQFRAIPSVECLT